VKRLKFGLNFRAQLRLMHFGFETEREQHIRDLKHRWEHQQLPDVLLKLS